MVNKPCFVRASARARDVARPHENSAQCDLEDTIRRYVAEREIRRTETPLPARRRDVFDTSATGYSSVKGRRKRKVDGRGCAHRAIEPPRTAFASLRVPASRSATAFIPRRDAFV